MSIDALITATPIVQEAARVGWQGLLPLGRREGQPPALAVIAPAAQLARLQTGVLSVLTPFAQIVGGGRPFLVIRVAPVGADGVALVRDLGVAEVRDLARDILAGGGLELLWFASDRGCATGSRQVALEPLARKALQTALAHAGEWHAEDPVQIGFSAEGWSALAAIDPTSPRLVVPDRIPEPVMLVVAASMLEGVGFARRPLAVGGGLTGDQLAASDLELRLNGDGAANRGLTIPLSLADGSQRRLAGQLATQRRLMAIGLGDGPTRGLRALARFGLDQRGATRVARAVRRAQRRAA